MDARHWLMSCNMNVERYLRVQQKNVFEYGQHFRDALNVLSTGQTSGKITPFTLPDGELAFYQLILDSRYIFMMSCCFMNVHNGQELALFFVIYLPA